MSCFVTSAPTCRRQWLTTMLNVWLESNEHWYQFYTLIVLYPVCDLGNLLSDLIYCWRVWLIADRLITDSLLASEQKLIDVELDTADDDERWRPCTSLKSVEKAWAHGPHLRRSQHWNRSNRRLLRWIQTTRYLVGEWFDFVMTDRTTNTPSLFDANDCTSSRGRPFSISRKSGKVHVIKPELKRHHATSQQRQQFSLSVWTS